MGVFECDGRARAPRLAASRACLHLGERCGAELTNCQNGASARAAPNVMQMSHGIMVDRVEPDAALWRAAGARSRSGGGMPRVNRVPGPLQRWLACLVLDPVAVASTECRQGTGVQAHRMTRSVALQGDIVICHRGLSGAKCGCPSDWRLGPNRPPLPRAQVLRHSSRPRRKISRRIPRDTLRSLSNKEVQ